MFFLSLLPGSVIYLDGFMAGRFRVPPTSIFFDLLVYLVFVVLICCNMWFITLCICALSFPCWPHHIVCILISLPIVASYPGVFSFLVDYIA